MICLNLTNQAPRSSPLNFSHSGNTLNNYISQQINIDFFLFVRVRECVCHPPLEIDSVTDPLVLWNLKTAIFWREVKKSTTRWLLRARAPVYLLNNSHVLIQRVGGGSAVSGGMMGAWGGGWCRASNSVFTTGTMCCCKQSVLLQWLRGNNGAGKSCFQSPVLSRIPPTFSPTPSR